MHRQAALHRQRYYYRGGGGVPARLAAVGGIPALPSWVTTSNLWADATQGNTDPQDMTAAWTRTNLTATANAVAGPYSGSFGDLITESTDGGNVTHEMLRSSLMDFDGTSAYIQRLVVKRINRSINVFFPATQFGGTAPQVTFNLLTGVDTLVAGTATSSMTDLGNGWWLCAMQATSTASGTNVTHRLFRLHNETAVSYTGTGADAVYIAAAGLHVV